MGNNEITQTWYVDMSGGKSPEWSVYRGKSTEPEVVKDSLTAARNYIKEKTMLPSLGVCMMHEGRGVYVIPLGLNEEEDE